MTNYGWEVVDPEDDQVVAMIDHDRPDTAQEFRDSGAWILQPTAENDEKEDRNVE